MSDLFDLSICCNQCTIAKKKTFTLHVGDKHLILYIYLGTQRYLLLKIHIDKEVNLRFNHGF